MSLRREAQKRVAGAVFRAGDRLGVHVLPAHYYSSVPHRAALRRDEDSWRHPLEPMPFPWDLDAQAAWFVDTAAEHGGELPLARLARLAEGVGGMRYGEIEAQFLHAWIRRHTPSQIVEIGSGSSTAVMSDAVARSVTEGRPETKIVACDPYTAGRVAHLPFVSAEATGGTAVGHHVDRLGPGDLVFIDSTHVVRTGSELPHLYLELLPRLPSGVVVHIHDITLPYLYAPDVYASMFDWQETTLLAALLAHSDRFEVLASQSALHHDRPDVIGSVFPEYRPRPMDRGLYAGPDGHFPSSTWLRVR
ncbi:class I SAM-dependent methyltransferase [Jatrophihabitans sp. YIM 134969]